MGQPSPAARVLQREKAAEEEEELGFGLSGGRLWDGPAGLGEEVPASRSGSGR